jgi:anti-anti-sigma factor
MSAGSFDVEVRRVPGRLIVAPQGELDIATLDQMRAVLADRREGEALELDLGGVDFMDTSGLQLVVEAHRDARRDGYDLTIVHGSTSVRRVFEMAGLDRVLPFTERRSEG